MNLRITRTSDGLVTGSIEWTEADHMIDHVPTLAGRGLKALALLVEIMSTTAPLAPPEPAPEPIASVEPMPPPAPIKTLSNGATIAAAAREPVPWTGRTLYTHAKRVRGMLEFCMSWGFDQKYPRRMLEWSAAQCDYAVGAWEAHQKRSVA